MAIISSGLKIAPRITVFDVEPAAWADPTVRTFDNRGLIRLSEHANCDLLDIIILGDGFTSSDRNSFTAYASDFYDRLMGIWPYSQFRSVFRVRAVFTESNTRSDASAPDTYYGIDMAFFKDKDGNDILTKPYPLRGIDSNSAYRVALFDTILAVTSAVGLNLRTNPDQLKTSWSALEPDRLSEVQGASGYNSFSKRHRNLTVVQSFMTDRADTGVADGYARSVKAPDGHSLDGQYARVAIGQHDVHEFGHAFGLLGDEYISHRDAYDPTLRQDPSLPSVFELSNVSFSARGDVVPWRHLGWDALSPRGSKSLVGQMWIGGMAYEHGVWHSEYMCLMNGGSNNYFCRTDETYMGGNDYHGSLRNFWASGRFCLWCEEIVTIRILEKTGAFVRANDPLDDDAINELGRLWYWRWVDELRAGYWKEFQLTQRIQDRENWYFNSGNINTHSELRVNGNVWNGDLQDSNLVRDITERPRPGSLTTLLFQTDD